MTSGEPKSKVRRFSSFERKIETIADGVAKRSEATCREPRPLFVRSGVRDCTHNRVRRSCIRTVKCLIIDVGTRPLPVMVRISQVLFDSNFPCAKLIQYGGHDVDLNKGPPVDGGGLFLGGGAHRKHLLLYYLSCCFPWQRLLALSSAGRLAAQAPPPGSSHASSSEATCKCNHI